MIAATCLQSQVVTLLLCIFSSCITLIRRGGVPKTIVRWHPGYSLDMLPWGLIVFLCMLGIIILGWVVLLKTILKSPCTSIWSTWFFSRGECFSFPNCICVTKILKPPHVPLFGELNGIGSYGWWSKHGVNPSEVFLALTIFFGLASMSNYVVSAFAVSFWGAHSTMGSMCVRVALFSMFRCLQTI